MPSQCWCTFQKSQCPGRSRLSSRQAYPKERFGSYMLVWASAGMQTFPFGLSIIPCATHSDNRTSTVIKLDDSFAVLVAHHKRHSSRRAAREWHQWDVLSHHQILLVIIVRTNIPMSNSIAESETQIVVVMCFALIRLSSYVVCQFHIKVSSTVLYDTCCFIIVDLGKIHSVDGRKMNGTTSNPSTLGFCLVDIGIFFLISSPFTVIFHTTRIIFVLSQFRHTASRHHQPSPFSRNQFQKQNWPKKKTRVCSFFFS